MKLMHSEWQDRVKHWVRTLRDDFYEPLGEIRLGSFSNHGSSISGRSITGALYICRTRFYMGENLGILLV